MGRGWRQQYTVHGCKKSARTKTSAQKIIVYDWKVLKYYDREAAAAIERKKREVYNHQHSKGKARITSRATTTTTVTIITRTTPATLTAVILSPPTDWRIDTIETYLRKRQIEYNTYTHTRAREHTYYVCARGNRMDLMYNMCAAFHNRVF